MPTHRVSGNSKFTENSIRSSIFQWWVESVVNLKMILNTFFPFGRGHIPSPQFAGVKLALSMGQDETGIGSLNEYWEDCLVQPGPVEPLLWEAPDGTWKPSGLASVVSCTCNEGPLLPRL